MSARGDEALWGTLPLTEHARRRMAQRGLSFAAVAAVLRHGRCVHARGACVYVVGRREVERASRAGVDLRALDGIHVLCAADGSILTVFRNRALALRDSSRSWRADERRRPRVEAAA
jgi:hypothetical protein